MASEILFVSCLILAFNIHLVHGQVSYMGVCPTVTPQSDFDVNKYVGMWFTYAKYPSKTVQGERCIRTQTSLNPDGQSTNLKTEQLIGVSMPMPLVYMGMSPFMPGSGIFNYTIMSRQGQTRNVPLTVLETDYTTYSVVYSCRMTGDNSNDRDLYIQTRSKDPPQESISKAYQAASNQGLDTMYLTKIDNDDCDGGSGSEESTTPESTN